MKKIIVIITLMFTSSILANDWMKLISEEKVVTSEEGIRSWYEIYPNIGEATNSRPGDVYRLEMSFTTYYFIGEHSCDEYDQRLYETSFDQFLVCLKDTRSCRGDAIIFPPMGGDPCANL